MHSDCPNQARPCRVHDRPPERFVMDVAGREISAWWGIAVLVLVLVVSAQAGLN